MELLQKKQQILLIPHSFHPEEKYCIYERDEQGDDSGDTPGMRRDEDAAKDARC